MQNITEIELNIDKEDFKKKLDIKDGKDYILTKKDKKDIAKSIDIPIIEKETIVREIEVALKDTPEEIKDKLETLKKDKRLDASAIKGLDKFVDKDIIDLIKKDLQFLAHKTSNPSQNITKLSQLEKDINFDERYYTESEIDTIISNIYAFNPTNFADDTQSNYVYYSASDLISSVITRYSRSTFNRTTATGLWADRLTLTYT